MTGMINFATFLLAAIIVVLTSGIDSVIMFTRSISKGRKAGPYSALGVSFGLLVHACAATFAL